MRDFWNPWHGCRKCSEGCEHCYMYYLDEIRGQDGSEIYKTKTGFRYPLSKTRDKQFKIQSGELLRVCMTSDFFLEEADEWRMEAWEIMHKRPDVKFSLLTKRPQRVQKCLPPDWGNGWENIIFNVTCENQRRADERIPILQELPFKHKGIVCAPLIGQVDIASYLETGQIEQVACGGENYEGSRPCHYEWVKLLYDQCKVADIAFEFFFLKQGQCLLKMGRLIIYKTRKYKHNRQCVQVCSMQGKQLNTNCRKILFRFRIKRY